MPSQRSLSVLERGVRPKQALYITTEGQSSRRHSLAMGKKIPEDKTGLQNQRGNYSFADL